MQTSGEKSELQQTGLKIFKEYQSTGLELPNTEDNGHVWLCSAIDFLSLYNHYNDNGNIL